MFGNKDEKTTINNHSLQKNKKSTICANRNQMFYKTSDKKKIEFQKNKNTLKLSKRKKAKHINKLKRNDINNCKQNNQHKLSIYTYTINNNISASASFNNGFFKNEIINDINKKNSSLINSYIFSSHNKFNNYSHMEISNKTPKSTKVISSRNYKNDSKIKSSDFINKSNTNSTINYEMLKSYSNISFNNCKSKKQFLPNNKLKNNLKIDLKNNFRIKSQNTTPSKITSSLIKSKKKVELLPEGDLKTLIVTDIKKQPKIKIISDKSGNKPKKIKNNCIIIKTENKKNESSKIKLAKKSQNVNVLKQIVTKKYETITINNNRIPNIKKSTKTINNRSIEIKNKKCKIKNKNDKNKKHKINLDMPKDIDFKQLQTINHQTDDDEIINENSSNNQNYNYLLDEGDNNSKTKTKKLNKLIEFITKLNESSNKEILSSNEELNIISIKKNQKTVEENDDEEIELSLQKEIELKTQNDEQNDNEIKSNDIISVEKENENNRYENENSLDIDNSEDLTERFFINDNKKYINNIKFPNVTNKSKEKNNNNNEKKTKFPKTEDEILSIQNEYVNVNELTKADFFDKFYAPLAKYQMSCELNKKNPFNNCC